MRGRLAAVAVLMVLLVTGCSRIVAGTAVIDPNRPGVAVTDDGYGIRVGSADAPLQLNIYTEPQCPACGRLQQRDGEKIKAHLMTGELAVTYRLETFLDRHTEYSAHVSNALFLAATPATSATAFQAYVIELWRHQDPEGSAGPSDSQLADRARDAGIPDAAVQRIADGESGVDVEEMGTANYDELSDIGAAGTPTVYDVNADAIIDTSDKDWLNHLLRTV